MTKLLDTELLEDRGRDLEVNGKNGVERVFVTLDTLVNPAHAMLVVEFYNDLYLAAILDKINNQGVPATEVFTISGGFRIPGGELAGQVQVIDVAAGSDTHILELKVWPIGDYSSYSLKVIHRDVILDSSNNPILNGDGNPVLESKIDPLFASIDFKFRPGCFNSNCAPGSRFQPPSKEPDIDYLAKDFDSFKHLLINTMRRRVPGWQPTSEADFDQVLIDLIAADADELSDYQDRVMNEAYFGRARKRVSLARHARLMDYHIHQGNQASTMIVLEVSADVSVAKGFGVWSGESWQERDAVIFAGVHDQQCYEDLSALSLYTWGGVVTALEAGSTEADIVSPVGTTKSHAEDLRDLILRTALSQEYRDKLKQHDALSLIVEEKLNPETGTENGRDKTTRQLLRLVDDDTAAEAIHDPVEDNWLVRVRWQERDKLRRRFCFITECPGNAPLEDVSLFYGNVLKVAHGRPHKTSFYPPGTELSPDDNALFERVDHAHYEYPAKRRWGTLCPLPHPFLAYRQTSPDGDTPPKSSLTVGVNGFGDAWEEQIDLIESESDATHFIVETDEYGLSSVRFGNNVNGRALPQDREVTCRYQIGGGSQGNIGPDSLTGFDSSPTGYPDVQAVWNPLDVTDGRDPELAAEIIRRAPQAYRSRQLRAITLHDYAKRAEELPEVSHAFARYQWTGSWRTVRVAIDPKDTNTLSESLRAKIAGHLDAVRLIGEDLEIRGAQYVPLDIQLKLCAHPDYWPEDLEFELATEFSIGYTAAGKMGFFHPNLWTFSQPLHASQLIGRAMSVQGVDRIIMVSIRRWHPGSGGVSSVITINPEDLPLNEIDILDVETYEIIQVENDPSQLEKGRIQFDIVGGRQ
ncbi:MAG: hypothetical protein GY799_20630 [Desulfobulbaceae bacterium]|nr:hypothetical protein [Desulfobulbaceae bacterium]